MSNYAPVLIITLNRYAHFRRCVESLGACTYAENTDLFIALDYPLNESHWEGYKQIEIFFESIEGFNSVNIIKRTENFGPIKNEEELLSQVFEKYDRIIYSEDDNEFSPNFLDYINKGLDEFENDENVLAICGYNYPITLTNNYINSYYRNMAFSGWGFGIWKRKSIKMDYEIDELIAISRKATFLKNSIKHYGLSQILLLFNAILQKKKRSGDISITISLLNENKYCIFPVLSKVRNHGHDGTGVNCGEILLPTYKKQQIDNDVLFNFTSTSQMENAIILKKVKKHFKIKVWIKIKLVMRIVINIILKLIKNAN